MIRDGRIEHVDAFGRELQYCALVPLDLVQVFPHRVPVVEADSSQQAPGDTIERGFLATQPVVEPSEERD
jgi:hypothetical protein